MKGGAHFLAAAGQAHIASRLPELDTLSPERSGRARFVPAVSRCARIIAPMVGGAIVLSCRQIAGITENPPQDLTTTVCGLP